MHAATVLNNQLLPPEVASGIWFGRARSYPIFSLAWWRYRSLSLLSGGALAFLVLAALLGAPMFDAPAVAIDWDAVAWMTALLAASFCVLCMAGPGLAVAVRRIGLGRRSEIGAILLALCGGLMLSFGLLVALVKAYEQPHFDLSKDAVVARKLPTIKINVQAHAGVASYFYGQRRAMQTPASPSVRAAVQQLIDANAAAAHHSAPPRIAAPQPTAGLTEADQRALADMKRLDAGDPSIDKVRQAAIENSYAAVIVRLYWETQRAMAVFRATPNKPAATPEQISAVEHLTAALPPAPAPTAPVPQDELSRGIGKLAVILVAIAALLACCWLGGLFDLVAFVHQRGKLVDVLQKEELQRTQAARNSAELRLSVLAAQVEPHFLFNTLASVRSAIGSDPQRATQIVDHMVAFLRSTIPQMRDDAASASVRLATQLDSARAYLALMHERIPRLQFEVAAEAGLEHASVPPLMLISLVENAVKHGVEPKVGAARIAVRARRADDGQLEISVADDGVGFGEAASGGGIGLANIQERLRSFYGQCASLTLKALPDGGVAAILRLPLSFES